MLRLLKICPPHELSKAEAARVICRDEDLVVEDEHRGMGVRWHRLPSSIQQAKLDSRLHAGGGGGAAAPLEAEEDTDEAVGAVAATVGVI